MTKLYLDGLAWRSAEITTDPTKHHTVIRSPDGHDMTLTWPQVVTADPAARLHISGWRVTPGGMLEEPSETEFGMERGYHRAGLDDQSWYRSTRINDVLFGFPTWEGSGYRGYLWYRTRVDRAPSDGPLRLTLGSPLEQRRLHWRVFVNEIEVTAGPTEGGILSIDLPDDLTSSADGELLVAVQLRVEPADLPVERVREREGWRSIDVFCHQSLHVVGSERALKPVGSLADGNRVTIDYGSSLAAEVSYEATDDLIRQRVQLVAGASGTPWIAEVRLAETADTPATYHVEGAWALRGRQFQAAIHPAAVTTQGLSGPRCVVWPGMQFGPRTKHQLPDVLIGWGPHDDGSENVRALLSRIGRPRTPYRIYDPYGWYQISHANEPKIELTDALIGDIDDLLTRMAERGTTFDALSLDCGWNDPDDLHNFHPGNFSAGAKGVRAVADRHGLDLMLWVSPSDGARAFRHEVGLADPRWSDCQSGNASFPWRLCPAAERWQAHFRSALLQHVTDNGVTGFKFDGTDLWCGSNAHDHGPGIHSIYATTTALIDTFEAIRRAGVTHLMLYWGLRSPWWLQYGDTLWERDYLVEAAAPSGVPAWSLRHGVTSSQDIGQHSSWSSIPTHQQDSLGVWVSNTAWASHQGSELWDDALVLDLSRGSLLHQLWGDLRLIEGPDDVERLRRIDAMSAARMPELLGHGSPLGEPWRDACYGYAWSSERGTWLVLVRPGDSGELTLDTAALQPSAPLLSIQLDYLSAGAAAHAALSGSQLTIRQGGGSVVALFLSHDPGQTEIGSRPASHKRKGWSPIGRSTRQLSSDPEDEMLAKAAFLGRAPQISPWLTGEAPKDLTLDEMLSLVPPNDRDLIICEETWRGAVVLDTDGEIAVVTSITRDGAAWHHDRLYELVALALHVDGTAVDPLRWPNRPHEQAGSWSSVVDRVRLPTGSYEVEAVVRSMLPASVQATTQLWVR